MQRATDGSRILTAAMADPANLLDARLWRVSRRNNLILVNGLLYGDLDVAMAIDPYQCRRTRYC
jgi:hypothetical protein